VDSPENHSALCKNHDQLLNALYILIDSNEAPVLSKGIGLLLFDSVST